MNIIKKYYPLLVSILLVSLFWLSFSVINHMYPFGSNMLINRDGEHQIWQFLYVLRDKMIERNGFNYMWNIGFGCSFFPMYFYYISAPINLMVGILNKDDIAFFMHITIIRIIASSGTFAFFLTKRYQSSANRIFIIPLSCAYALSGYICGYYHESMWLDSYMIFPIIMYGYYRLIEQKKPAVYILSLVYSAVCSFYITYMIALFLVLWHLFEYKGYIKEYLKNTIYFSLSSLLAVGMSAFSLIISFLCIKDNSDSSAFKMNDSYVINILKIIRYQFFLSKPVTVSEEIDVANVYCGCFVIVFLFVYILNSNISIIERVKKLVLVAILYVSLCVATLNYIWHGFHTQNGVPNRFSFLIIFVLLVISYEALISEIKVRLNCIIAFLGILFLPILVYVFAEYDSQYSQTALIIASTIFMAVYIVMTILFKSKYGGIRFGLFIIMLAEIFVNSFISFKNETADIVKLYGEMKKVESYVGDTYNDDSFYRVSFSDLGLRNIGCYFNRNYIDSFSSIDQNDTHIFMRVMGETSYQSDMRDYGVYRPLDDILGIKYKYYCNNIDYIQLSDEAIELNSDYFTNETNDDAFSIAYGVNKEIDGIKFNYSEVIENVNKLAYSMSGKKNVLRELHPSVSVSTYDFDISYGDSAWPELRLESYNNYEGIVNFSFEAEESSEYSIYINENYYLKLLIDVDGIRKVDRFIDTDSVYNLGFIDKGSRVNISIISSQKLFDKYGVMNANYPTDALYLGLRVFVPNEEVINEFVTELDDNQMKITTFSPDRISGNVYLDKNQVLFTTIPYDKGWHLYDNGEEVKTERYAGAFLGADIGEGQHELEFVYVPRGFYLGIAVTVVSWMIFILVLLGNKILFIRIRDNEIPKLEENNKQ